ncbi:MAG: YceI family protein [Chloroflexota bacterium]|nr:YceI family protein [Chloroflexota bacterium]
MKFLRSRANIWGLSCLVFLSLGCSSGENVNSDAQKIEAGTSAVQSINSLSPVPTISSAAPKVSNNSSPVLTAEPTIVTELKTPTVISEIPPPKNAINSSKATSPSLKQPELTTRKKAIAISFQTGSVARYKIGEQFARLPTPITAIGETSVINGKVYLNNEGYISDSDDSIIVVDVQSLKSDENKRDNWVRRNGGIGSEISINIREILGHPWPLPEVGDMQVSIKGHLTISEITKPIVWEGLLTKENGNVTGLISTIITWDQFSLSKPRLPFIISVDDEIILELDVVATIEQ